MSTLYFRRRNGLHSANPITTYILTVSCSLYGQGTSTLQSSLVCFINYDEKGFPLVRRPSIVSDFHFRLASREPWSQRFRANEKSLPPWPSTRPLQGRNDLPGIEDTTWESAQMMKSPIPARTPSGGVVVGLMSMRIRLECEVQAGMPGNAAVTRMTLPVVEV
jgi:hypothetical protein